MWGLSRLLDLPALLMELLKGWMGLKAKEVDAGVEASKNARDVATAVVSNDTARIQASRDITLGAMNHPLWWFAWGLGVFPVLTYHAAVFWVSTFPGLGWTVLKVPGDQIEFAHTVTNWMFGLGGGSAVVTSIISAWRKRV